MDLFIFKSNRFDYYFENWIGGTSVSSRIGGHK